MTAPLDLAWLDLVRAFPGEPRHQLEARAGERQAAHVTCHPRQGRRLGEERRRQIDPEGAVATPAQCRGVPAGAAGEVEHGVWRLVTKKRLHEIDVLLGLAAIAVGVELEVLLAEPLLVPGHGRE